MKGRNRKKIGRKSWKLKRRRTESPRGEGFQIAVKGCSIATNNNGKERYVPTILRKGSSREWEEKGKVRRKKLKARPTSEVMPKKKQ